MKKYREEIEKVEKRYEISVAENKKLAAEAERIFQEENRKLLESIREEIAEYQTCRKKYFVRKEETIQRLNKERAVAEERYMALREKVAGYPDFIPEKYRTVPMIDEEREYELYITRDILQSLLAIMQNGRADTLKEATSCYQADLQAEEQRRILLEQPKTRGERRKDRKSFSRSRQRTREWRKRSAIAL